MGIVDLTVIYKTMKARLSIWILRVITWLLSLVFLGMLGYGIYNAIKPML